MSPNERHGNRGLTTKETSSVALSVTGDVTREPEKQMERSKICTTKERKKKWRTGKTGEHEKEERMRERARVAMGLRRQKEKHECYKSAGTPFTT